MILTLSLFLETTKDNILQKPSEQITPLNSPGGSS